tara:strand:+ start:226616 stop:227740 length:1125 start_codon:yes stop_codon:yes gene_type:complete
MKFITIIFSLLLIFSLSAQDKGTKSSSSKKRAKKPEVVLPVVKKENSVFQMQWRSNKPPYQTHKILANTIKTEIRKKLKGKVLFHSYILPEETENEKVITYKKSLIDFLDQSEEDKVHNFQIVDLNTSVIAKELGLPAYYLFDYPFLFAAYYKIEEFFKTPIAKTMVKMTEDKGFVNLGFYYTHGFRVFPSEFQRIKSVDDLKNYKMDKTDSDFNNELYKALGITLIDENTAPEYLNSIQKDSGDISMGGLYEMYVYGPSDPDNNDVIHILNSRHSVAMSAMLIDKNYFDTLPKDVQKGLREAFKVALAKQRQWVVKEDERVLKDIEKWDIGLSGLGLFGMKTFREKTKTVREKYEKLIGKNAIEIAQDDEIAP